MIITHLVLKGLLFNAVVFIKFTTVTASRSTLLTSGCSVRGIKASLKIMQC
jgi:hypothetical protein